MHPLWDRVKIAGHPGLCYLAGDLVADDRGQFARQPDQTLEFEAGLNPRSRGIN